MTRWLYRYSIALALVGVLSATAMHADVDVVDAARSAVEPTSTTTTTERPTTTSAQPTTSTAQPTTTSTAQPTTTAQPSVSPQGVKAGAGAVRTPSGIITPVVRREGSQVVALTPCANEAVVTGEFLDGAHVVLDAGHGGSEPGAVGPNGLAERDLNLDIALRARDKLEAEGATVVLTRDRDVRVTIVTRAELAKALSPLAFVSIHHNAAPLTKGPRIGSELYHQHQSPESKRLAGLLHEEYVRVLQPMLDSWAWGDDPGARARLSSSGDDFYGVLRRSQGVAAVLSEASFLSDPEEAALAATEEFRDAEATAITRAIVRYMTTADPGSGFVPAKVSDAPAGGGGGTAGCEDPALG